MELIWNNPWFFGAALSAAEPPKSLPHHRLSVRGRPVASLQSLWLRPQGWLVATLGREFISLSFIHATSAGQMPARCERSQVRQPLRYLALLGIVRHALVIFSSFQHLVACNVDAKLLGHRAAFPGACPAATALWNGDR